MANDNSNSLLVVISAPSGGGKTTVCQKLLAGNPNLARAVTCTTREPRAGEKEGVDYYFLDAGSFLKRVQAIGAGVLTDADMDMLQASIDANRTPHHGIDL